MSLTNKLFRCFYEEVMCVTCFHPEVCDEGEAGLALLADHPGVRGAGGGQAGQAQGGGEEEQQGGQGGLHGLTLASGGLVGRGLRAQWRGFPHPWSPVTPAAPVTAPCTLLPVSGLSGTEEGAAHRDVPRPALLWQLGWRGAGGAGNWESPPHGAHPPSRGPGNAGATGQGGNGLVFLVLLVTRPQ